MRRLGEWLYLRPGELGRAGPFFGLYLIVFAAFTLADGLSMALFLERVGARHLPLAYALTAAANLVLIAGYIVLSERVSAARLLQGLLLATGAIYFAAWWELREDVKGPLWYGALFISREVTFTLVILHFGTYLQDYFTRDELNRVLPLVYAGGRVGGIVGGALLASLIGPVRPIDLLVVFLVLCLVAALAGEWIGRAQQPLPMVRDEPSTSDEPRLEAEARASLGGFLRYAWVSPLLFWASATSLLFMMTRWTLNYRYSEFFERHFEGVASMAEFLGVYTQVALFAALLVQLLLVSRLVAWFGLGAAYLGLAALLCAGSLLVVPEVTLATALVARFLETELRLGLRNPLMQLLSNQFARPIRVRVRAWTMGLLTPVGTGLMAVLLWGAPGVAGWITGIVGVAFLVTGVGLYGALRKCEGNQQDEPGG